MGRVAGAQTSQPRCPSPCARGGRLASPRTPVQRSGQQLRWPGGGRRRAASGPQAPHPCPRQTPGGKAVTARSQSDCLAQGSRRPRAGLAGDQDARGHWLRLPRRKAFAIPGSQDCSGPWGASHWTRCTWSRPALGEDARSGSLGVSSCPETPTLLWTKATPICFCCGLGRRMLKL